MRRGASTLLTILLTGASLSGQFPGDPLDRRGESDVRGEIVVENGPLDDRIFVELKSFQATMPHRTMPTGSGMFEFSMVPVGEYELRITDRFGNVLHREFVSVTDNVNNFQVRLTLPEQERPVNGTVSVAQLGRKVPSEAVEEFDKAGEAHKNGEISKAIAHLEKAVEIAPEYMEAHNDLGVRYMDLGDFQRAISCFEEAARLDPGSATVYQNLAVSYFASHRFSDAEEAARRALRYDPSAIKARFLLGMSLKAQHPREAEALEYLRDAASEIPKAHLAVAEILMAQGERAEAAAELQKYLNSSEAEDRATVEAWIAELGE